MSEPVMPPLDDSTLDDDVELACSSCNADLSSDELFLSHRVCPSCGRHFWLPARERIQLLVDDGSFQETNAELVSLDPLLFHDRLPVPDRLAEVREQPAVAEAVVTGTGTIGGHRAVIVALDLAVFGVGIGIVAGEKIALAMEQAVTHRLPVIAICSGGGGKGQEGVLSLAQVAKLASASARLRRVGVPLIALLTHPTSGNALVGIANQADIAFAEPGAQIGRDARSRGGGTTAEALIEHGAIDGVIDRVHQRELFERMLRLLAHRGTPRGIPTAQPGATGLRAHEELAFAQRVDRPTARDYVARLAVDYVELRGDRLSADSPSVVGGIGRIEGVTAVIIGTVRDDNGATGAAFAKVNRLLRLAAHLELPVVSFVETGRAIVDDPEAGLGMALTLSLLTAMPVPVIAVALGEVAGPAGMALLTADRVVMQEHAVVSMSAGDPVASARDCLRLGLADAIVSEPDPAADADPETATRALGAAIANALTDVAGAGSRRLLDDRARRLRHLGLSTDEGREAARIEWRELQDLQRAIGRSIDDLRQRWEHRQLPIPTIAGRSWPALPTIALPKLNLRRPDLAELASRVQTTRLGLAHRDHHETVSGEDIDGQP